MAWKRSGVRLSYAPPPIFVSERSELKKMECPPKLQRKRTWQIMGSIYAAALSACLAILPANVLRMHVCMTHGAVEPETLERYSIASHRKFCLSGEIFRTSLIWECPREFSSVIYFPPSVIASGRTGITNIFPLNYTSKYITLQQIRPLYSCVHADIFLICWRRRAEGSFRFQNF